MNSDNKHTPLRILHAITFYDEYLSRFYAGRSSLTRAPYATHIKALIHDAHAAIHLLPPYLNNCQAQFVVPNCVQSQQAWARENAIPFDTWTAATQEALLLAQLDAIRPDIIYFNNTILFQADFIKKIPYTPRLIVGWRAADVPWNVDWTGYDIILSGLPRLLAFAPTVGAKEGAFFVPGMPHWIAREVENIPQDIDVVFAGGISPTQHGQRLAMLDAVAQAASQYGFSLRLHLSCAPQYITEAMRPYLAPPVFGLDMHYALRRGRIVVDSRGTAGLRHPNGSYMLDFGGDELCTMRQFEATGGGSMLITENLEGIKRYFEPGKEIITCNNIEEYISNIVHFTTHEEERKRIANNGQQRCMRDWSMRNATQRFMNIVQQALAHN